MYRDDLEEKFTLTGDDPAEFLGEESTKSEAIRAAIREAADRLPRETP